MIQRKCSPFLCSGEDQTRFGLIVGRAVQPEAARPFPLVPPASVVRCQGGAVKTRSTSPRDGIAVRQQGQARRCVCVGSRQDWPLPWVRCRHGAHAAGAGVSAA